MYNSTDFLLYEELLSYFDLEGPELLSKLFYKLGDIIDQFNALDCFIECPSGNKIVIMNEYQQKSAIIVNTLLNLWDIRN